ncbi:hypothetical protein MP228_002123 [Amoeboaphelidium protococcarum]|nr:hypothetical protein MP228_002123 [Amoeboaphelidium protococcarum]
MIEQLLEERIQYWNQVWTQLQLDNTQTTQSAYQSVPLSEQQRSFEDMNEMPELATLIQLQSQLTTQSRLVERTLITIQKLDYAYQFWHSVSKSFFRSLYYKASLFPWTAASWFQQLNADRVQSFVRYRSWYRLIKIIILRVSTEFKLLISNPLSYCKRFPFVFKSAMSIVRNSVTNQFRLRASECGNLKVAQLDLLYSLAQDVVQDSHLANDFTQQQTSDKGSSSGFNEALTKQLMNAEWMQKVCDISAVGSNCQYSDLDLDSFIEQLRVLEDAYKRVSYILVRQNGPPTGLQSRWIIITLCICLVSQIGHDIAISWDSIISFMHQFQSTLIDYFQNWIVQPSIQVYETIRNSNGQQQNSMAEVNPQILEEDIKSLSRMLVDFSKDSGSNNNHSEDVSLDIQDQIKVAYPILLNQYEDKIKSPLRGTLSIGQSTSLPRILLIQVQKLKIDVVSALVGVEKLLKSNELNFAVFSAGPSLLIAYAAYRLVARLLTSLWSSVNSLATTSRSELLDDMERHLYLLEGGSLDGQLHSAAASAEHQSVIYHVEMIHSIYKRLTKKSAWQKLYAATNGSNSWMQPAVEWELRLLLRTGTDTEVQVVHTARLKDLLRMQLSSSRR